MPARRSNLLSILSIVVSLLAIALAVLTLSGHKDRHAVKNHSSAPAATNGWIPLSAGPMTGQDPHEVLPSFVRDEAVPALPPGVDATSYDVQVDGFQGQPPLGLDGHPVTTGDVYNVLLDLQQDQDLQAKGSVCLDSLIVLQLPKSDLSDPAERMHECSDKAVVLMTVIVSQVL